jgi:heat shock protein HtpX
MAWLKRIGLFMAVNILVVITISLILNVLGVKPYLTQRGIDYSSLIVFCLIWGMGGAFISLALSRQMAKWMMGVKIISPDVRDPHLRDLVVMVHDLAQAARLPAMPEVGVYESPEVNAFATGPSKSRSLVAVSSGLLQRMRREEIKGVLGHEVAHIANGDMVTMTLIQGVVNAFVMFLARVIAFAITMAGQKDSDEERGTPFSYYIVQMVLEIVFMILGSMVVAWFSRRREFRADKGGARLAGRESMIAALQGLQMTFDAVEPAGQTAAIQSLKISSRPGGIMRFFSTHPPLEERIARLMQAR